MKPLIIDIGSYALKLGFGGEYAPRLDIPLILGKIKEDLDYTTKKSIFKQLKIRDVKQEYFLGNEALYLRNFVDLKWLYNGRAILDEFFFGKLFESAIASLKVTLSNQTILITQPFHSEIIHQLGTNLFSTYYTPEIVPAFQPLLNSLASGVQTGLIIDLGHFLTQITPIVNGVLMVEGVRVLDLGGNDITNVLHQMLIENAAFDGLNLSSILSTEMIAENIKEVYCYMSRNPAEELDDPQRRGSEIKYPLLNGEIIQIGVERFLAPEFLFAPQNKPVDPLDKTIFDVIASYDSSIQQALLGNILITGGTSLLPGLAERLYEELVRKFIDFNYKVHIVPFAQYGSPRYSSFFGAAKLAAIEIQNSLKISKADFKRSGKLNVPVTFLEEFNTIFQQTEAAQLDPIIISVKNFYNSRLYLQLYNIVNSRREISVNAIGNQLQRSPIELYGMIETLLSYKIIQGEFAGFNFINSQFREEIEELPVQREAPKPKPKPRVQPEMGEEEAYIPSFQRLDAEMPSNIPSPSSTSEESEARQYEYTYEKIDGEMQETWAKDATIPSGKPKSASKTEALEETGFTFERIDREKAEEYASDPTIISETRSSTPRKKVQEVKGYTFEKIDQQMAEDWEREGIVSTPKRVEPRGFFDRIAIPVEAGEVKPTFEKVETEKAAEWAADEVVITGEKESARDRLKELISAGPSYVQAEKEKAAEWEESGLILVPKKPSPRGFFERPTAATKPEEDLPTFLKIKDQEVPQPRKVMMEGLLKPKAEAPRTALPTESKLPTYLEGRDLTEEQLKEFKEFEEAERRKKEKEEKLL